MGILLIVLSMLPGLVVVGLLSLQKKGFDNKVSPLSKPLYRPPGYQLFKDIETLRSALLQQLVFVMFSPPLFVAFLFLSGEALSVMIIAISLMLLTGGSAWGINKILKMNVQLQKIKL